MCQRLQVSYTQCQLCHAVRDCIFQSLVLSEPCPFRDCIFQRLTPNPNPRSFVAISARDDLAALRRAPAPQRVRESTLFASISRIAAATGPQPMHELRAILAAPPVPGKDDVSLGLYAPFSEIERAILAAPPLLSYTHSRACHILLTRAHALDPLHTSIIATTLLPHALSLSSTNISSLFFSFPTVFLPVSRDRIPPSIVFHIASKSNPSFLSTHNLRNLLLLYSIAHYCVRLPINLWSFSIFSQHDANIPPFPIIPSDICPLISRSNTILPDFFAKAKPAAINRISSQSFHQSFSYLFDSLSQRGILSAFFLFASVSLSLSPFFSLPHKNYPFLSYSDLSQYILRAEASFPYLSS